MLLDDVESGREGPAKGEHVANLEERVTDLEGHAESQTRAIDGLRTDIADLRGELRTSVAQLRSEMALRSDIGDLRREMGDQRREMGDLRRDMGDLRNDMNRRSDLLDAKIDRHFVWLMGMMVIGFITVIGALVGVVYR